MISGKLLARNESLLGEIESLNSKILAFEQNLDEN
jgi:hypothetical protein